MMIDTIEAARRLGVTPTRVQQLLMAGRIVGGQKIGGQRGVWIIEVHGDEPPVVLPPQKLTDSFSADVPAETPPWR